MNAALHLGRIEGEEIVCPLHKSRFNIRSGKKVEGPKIPIPKILKMGSMMANVKTHDLKKFKIKAGFSPFLIENKYTMIIVIIIELYSNRHTQNLCIF